MRGSLTKIRRTRARWILLAGLLALLLPVHWGTSLIAAERTETEVQAAYLYNFAKFVTWPEQSFESPSSPVVIGIVDRDRLSTTVSQTIGTNTANSRRVTIRVVNPNKPDLTGCHMLYISRAESDSIPALLTAAKASPILTVSDAEHFAADGGMIGFIRVDNSLKLEINHSRATEAGLRISSKLLALAKIIKPSAP